MASQIYLPRCFSINAAANGPGPEASRGAAMRLSIRTNTTCRKHLPRWMVFWQASNTWTKPRPLHQAPPRQLQLTAVLCRRTRQGDHFFHIPFISPT